MPSSVSLQRPTIATMIAIVTLCAGAVAADAQSSGDLPFAPGEKFEYAGRVHVGVSGRGTLRVDGPSEVRGTTVWTLHSDMEGKLGFLRASDRSVSWLDPVHMSALRFTARERHLLTKHDDDVSIFASEKRWAAEDGTQGPLVSEQPLDELSFLYFLRTLPLADEAELTVSRHFDAARNPTIVRVVGREEIEVDAGRFRAVIVEMRVRDARRYKGEGVIRIHLSDDACRLILRLESNMPDAGKATLALTSYEGTRPVCAAKLN
ncbi:MAG: hypothetical protein JWL61_4367 [Gemmatimonadetes bacterium]|nr:hypothetical protein [Gemmatimonadota bacterium]